MRSIWVLGLYWFTFGYPGLYGLGIALEALLVVGIVGGVNEAGDVGCMALKVPGCSMEEGRHVLDAETGRIVFDLA